MWILGFLGCFGVVWGIPVVFCGFFEFSTAFLGFPGLGYLRSLVKMGVVECIWVCGHFVWFCFDLCVLCFPGYCGFGVFWIWIVCLLSLF